MSALATPARRAGFTGLLLATMAVATFMPSSLGIVATFLLDDLGISRTQVGALIGVTSVVAALASPLVGSVTDALGGRRAVVGVFVFAASGFAGLAAAPAYWVMFVPVILASVGQAAANPATNKLIAAQLPVGGRGLVTGIKQSGVQLGIFLGGLALPSAALAFGWRWAYAVVAVIPVLVVPAAIGLVPPDGPRVARRQAGARDSLPPSVPYLGVFGGLMGFGAAYTFLVPLYVEEGVGMSARAGGLAAAVTGLCAFVGRILWARAADRRIGVRGALVVISAGGVAAATGYAAASIAWSWLVWPAAALTGMTTSSWMSVGMLAVMSDAGPERTGRASGVVMLGFLAGLGIAPPVFGWSVDASGSYGWMWVMSVATLALGIVVLGAWSRSSARRPALPGDRGRSGR